MQHPCVVNENERGKPEFRLYALTKTHKTPKNHNPTISEPSSLYIFEAPTLLYHHGYIYRYENAIVEYERIFDC